MSPDQDQSPFEALPLELHFNVLRHMSGPEDVLSTIQASPAALHALQTGRECIYAAVLPTRLAPEVFREFLAILDAPDHNTCPIPRPAQTSDGRDAGRVSTQELQGWELKAGEFLRKHALGAIYSAPSPEADVTKFKTQTRFMIRLYFCVTRLISYYLPDARSRVLGTRISLPPVKPAFSGPPRLTETELLRMQRGLLRYELCCRLIGLPSIAAYSSPRVFYDPTAMLPRPDARRDFWEVNPLTSLLPLDETEEITCATEYVSALYSRIRERFDEDFKEAMLDFIRGREISYGVSEDTVRMRLWWCHRALRGDYRAFQWGAKFGRRLGLVFVDRMTRSAPADRRNFLRTCFHTFRTIGYQRAFLGDSWRVVVYRRGFRRHEHRFSPLPVGPHCNAILKTCSTNHELAKILTYPSYNPSILRRNGWAFFDYPFRVRCLDLPQDHSPSGVKKWVLDEYDSREPSFIPSSSTRSSIRPNRSRSTNVDPPDSVLSSRFTGDEWTAFYGTYEPKDLQNDFHAMSRFLADVRGVVDFKLDRLPQTVSDTYFPRKAYS